jgi:type II secretory pathway pseudopilin PulG
MFKLNRKNKKAITGFTLFEVLLSIALVLSLVTLAVPVYQSFISDNDLETAVDQSARALRNAQIYAQQIRNDSEWGVRIDEGLITVFMGNSYATRDSDFDIVYDIATGIELSGINEIYYEKVTGNPSGTGTITFQINDKTNEITINEKGGLTFQ